MAKSNSSTAPPNKPNHQTGVFYLYKTMFHYQKHYPFLILLLIFGMSMGIVYECMIPLVFKWLFNDVLISKSIPKLITVICILVISYLFMIISGVMQTISSSMISSRVMSMMRFKMFYKIQSLTLEGKKEDFESHLISCFTNDITFLESVSVYVYWNALKLVALIIVGTCLLIYFDWFMTLSVALFVPLTLIIPRILSRKSNLHLLEKKRLERSVLNNIQENITMQDVIRLHLLKRFKRSIFKNRLIELQDESYRQSKNAILSGQSAVFGVNLINLLVISVGGYLVTANYLNLGQFVGFYLLIGSINYASCSLSNIYPLLRQVAVSLDNIEHLIKEEIPRSNVFPQSIHRFKNSICFNNVSFSYDNKPFIKEINLKILVGTSVAIVGQSGCGKSSMLKLILKEVKPCSGQLLFDGEDYKHITQASLLSQIGIVMQQPKLFEGSISDNIRMGKLDATEHEIITAAKKAGIHEDIMRFSKQYNTMIGPRNSGLSGGQAQRVAIARALISNPSIICLDEATSALDPFSASEIENTITSMMSSKHTFITITHRLSSIVHSDLIIVMDNGEIVETGTHLQLLEKKGMYFNLWDKQHGFIIDPQNQKISIIPSWLRHVSLFKTLEPSILDDLAKEMVMERVQKDNIVFNQGDSGDKFYILVAGKINVLKYDADGNEKLIARLSDGDFFGELALIYDAPRNATIRTTTVCIFITLNQKSFEEVIQQLTPQKRSYLYREAKKRLDAS